jgi:erythronate-4-phosphate dehydrogenase
MRIIADANIPFVRECFSSLGDVRVLGGREITPEVVANADALLVRSITQVNERLLGGSSVRFVGTATIGVDHVDVAYLERSGIGFASAPGSNANSAAEYVIAALLEVARRRGLRLAGKSIGVIGVGNVGSRVARKCEALGMEVRRNDPPLARSVPVRAYPKERLTASLQTDPKYVPIEALYDCDFITIHTPLTREGIDKTFHLADADFFSRLKPGVVFVNASRGAVVETGALKAAMQAGRLQAVVLDVWEGEPNIDVGLLEKVDLGTPHIAGYSFDGKVTGMIMIYRSLCEHFHLAPKFDVKDFLPVPAIPRLEIETGSVGSEKGGSGLRSATESPLFVARASCPCSSDGSTATGAGEAKMASRRKGGTPSPRGSDLSFSDLSTSDEELLACVAEKIYSVAQDDRQMRQIANQPPEAQGRFFDALRKNYPVRREFRNTTVVLDRWRESLAQKLRGLDFGVEERR